MQHIIQPREIIGNYQTTDPIRVNFGTRSEEGMPVIYMQYSFASVDCTIEVLGKDKNAAIYNILIRLTSLYDTLQGLDANPGSISGLDSVARGHHEEMRRELSDIICQKL